MLLPRAVRKWIAVFRGDFAPILIVLSALLGFWFGLMPGWYGLHVGLIVLVLVLNVHIGLFLLSAALGKALCYAAAPVLYHAGVWAHESAPGLVGAVAAVPILGMSDFSRYALLGGLLLGPPVGLVLGLALAYLVQSFRRTWLRLEEGSPALVRWRQKRWVRFLDWLLLGKSSDARAALQKRARYVRVPGVIVAGILLAACGAAAYLVQNTVMSDYAAQSLTAVNRAEVDLAGFELAPFRGRIAVQGLRATDPTRPQQNRVAIDDAAADVSLWGLLFGRVVMDEVTLKGVAFDTPRAAPGRVVTRATPVDAEPFDPAHYKLSDVDVAKLEAYLRRAEQVRAWLAQVRDWLPPAKSAARRPTSVPERYLEYLTARAPGPAAPRFVIRRLLLDPVQTPAELFGSSQVLCTNLSDAPRGSSAPLTVRVESHDRPASCQISYRGGADAVAEFTATFEELDLRELQEHLDPRNPVVLEGGRATAKLTGTLSRENIDLAIRITTTDLQASTTGGGLFGLDPEVAGEAMKLLREVETTLRLVGPATEPRLVFDSSALRAELREALVRAGKDELLRRMDQLVGDKLPGGVPQPDKVLNDPLGAVGDALPGALGGKKRKDD